MPRPRRIARSIHMLPSFPKSNPADQTGMNTELHSEHSIGHSSHSGSDPTHSNVGEFCTRTALSLDVSTTAPFSISIVVRNRTAIKVQRIHAIANIACVTNQLPFRDVAVESEPNRPMRLKGERASTIDLDLSISLRVLRSREKPAIPALRAFLENPKFQ